MSPRKLPPSAPSDRPADPADVLRQRSRRTGSGGRSCPSPRLAIAHDESTTVWPCAARRSQRPGSDGASATPIGRKREFMSAAAAIAAAMPAAAAEDRDRRELRRAGEDDRRHDDRADRREADLAREHAERQRQHERRDRERHAGPQPGAKRRARRLAAAASGGRRSRMRPSRQPVKRRPLGRAAQSAFGRRSATGLWPTTSR